MVANNRGQVLLLGGLAIAIVFLAAIPLSNSLVVSESASSSDAIEEIDAAAEREASVERGLRSLARDANTSNASKFNRTLRNFSTYYTNVSGRQDGVYVNASLNPDESARTLSAQEYTVPDGSPGNQPWSPVNNSTRISGFNATFNRTETTAPESQPFQLTISNDSGVQYRLEAYTRTNAGTKKLFVDPDSGPGDCTSTTDDLKIDVLNGTCYIGSTEDPVSGFSPGDGEYDIQIGDKPNQATGSFTLAADGDFHSGISNDDEFALIIRMPAIDLLYAGPDASYERTITTEGES